MLLQIEVVRQKRAVCNEVPLVQMPALEGEALRARRSVAMVVVVVVVFGAAVRRPRAGAFYFMIMILVRFSVRRAGARALALCELLIACPVVHLSRSVTAGLED